MGTSLFYKYAGQLGVSFSETRFLNFLFKKNCFFAKNALSRGCRSRFFIIFRFLTIFSETKGKIKKGLLDGPSIYLFMNILRPITWNLIHWMFRILSATFDIFFKIFTEMCSLKIAKKLKKQKIAKKRLLHPREIKKIYQNCQRLL